MTAQIQAIETRYAGYRFRSRLEARWAVFFDNLEIPWIYEPQGYVIDGVAYLPDFWLPTMHLWAEVKGVVTDADMQTLVKAARWGGLPADGPGSYESEYDDRYSGRLLILGQFPNSSDPRHVFQLDAVKDCVLASAVTFSRGRMRGTKKFGWITSNMRKPIFLPLGEPFEQYALDDLTFGIPSHWSNFAEVDSALDAARSARFEHGERP